MNHKEVMQIALEALGKMYTPRQPKAEDFDLVLAAITALRAALEQQEQEPVAWACFKNGEPQTELVGTEADVDFWCASDEPEMQGMVKGALYTHPPRREAQPEQEPPEQPIDYFAVQRIANERGLDYNRFAAALRDYAALAQQEQEQEPVAHYYAKHLAIAIWEKHYKDTAPDWRPLPDLMGVLTQIDNMAVGLAPPRREWQSLTEEEIDAVAAELGYAQLTPREVARAIEAALKERNT
jgi:hypothetical protein